MISLRLFFLLLPCLLLPACRALSVADQRRLHGPAMQLGERGAVTAECSLSGLIEGGRAGATTAGGGCSSCH